MDILNEWLLEHVVPNVDCCFPLDFALVLALLLLWAVFDDDLKHMASDGHDGTSSREGLTSCHRARGRGTSGQDSRFQPNWGGGTGTYKVGGWQISL
eukprot:14572747-Ditylum_brightwellii.AAC.1